MYQFESNTKSCCENIENNIGPPTATAQFRRHARVAVGPAQLALQTSNGHPNFHLFHPSRLPKHKKRFRKSRTKVQACPSKTWLNLLACWLLLTSWASLSTRGSLGTTLGSTGGAPPPTRTSVDRFTPLITSWRVYTPSPKSCS